MVEIGEAARRSGVGIETIRYYEREGIVPKPARQANNRRLYSAEDIGRLRFLRRCRDLGFPLGEARLLLRLSLARADDCAAVRAMAEAQAAAVRQRIAELTELEAALRELSANCADGNPSCPMLARMRDAGSGAVTGAAHP